jgi:hypothetical protein
VGATSLWAISCRILMFCQRFRQFSVADIRLANFDPDRVEHPTPLANVAPNRLEREMPTLQGRGMTLYSSNADWAMRLGAARIGATRNRRREAHSEMMAADASALDGKERGAETH